MPRPLESHGKGAALVLKKSLSRFRGPCYKFKSSHGTPCGLFLFGLKEPCAFAHKRGDEVVVVTATKSKVTVSAARAYHGAGGNFFKPVSGELEGSEKMRTAMPHKAARSDEGLSRTKALVRRFERCQLPLDSFNHREHLAVALFYLTQMPVQEAVHQFRTAILRFIKHYNETGYNETITMFWLNLIARFLMKSAPARPITDMLDELLETYGDSHLIYTYYSRDLLMSDQAKTTWIAPDLKTKDEG